VGFGISVGDPGELRIQRLSADNYAIFVSWRCLFCLTLSGIVSGASIHMASSHKATVYNHLKATFGAFRSMSLLQGSGLSHVVKQPDKTTLSCRELEQRYLVAIDKESIRLGRICRVFH
jgi:hypothetical protein